MTNILLGKPEGQWTLWRPGSRLDDNIKIDVTETEWGMV